MCQKCGKLKYRLNKELRMIKYYYNMSQDEFDKLYEVESDRRDDGHEHDCECCLDIGHLEVSTDNGWEIQECEECSYMHHIEE